GVRGTLGMMRVWLSQVPASAEWGPRALLSHDTEGMHVHLGSRPLSAIQRAARRLYSQGLRRVQLAGEWSLDQQWAFALGWMSSREPGELHWAGEDPALRARLQARLLCARWIREQTNASPEQLSPVALAVEAASFLTGIAPDQVSHRILK